jgi:hypothetical protein
MQLGLGLLGFFWVIFGSCVWCLVFFACGFEMIGLEMYYLFLLCLVCGHLFLSVVIVLLWFIVVIVVIEFFTWMSYCVVGY